MAIKGMETYKKVAEMVGVDDWKETCAICSLSVESEEYSHITVFLASNNVKITAVKKHEGFATRKDLVVKVVKFGASDKVIANRVKEIMSLI